MAEDGLGRANEEGKEHGGKCGISSIKKRQCIPTLEELFFILWKTIIHSQNPNKRWENQISQKMFSSSLKFTHLQPGIVNFEIYYICDNLINNKGKHQSDNTHKDSKRKVI